MVIPASNVALRRPDQVPDRGPDPVLVADGLSIAFGGRRVLDRASLSLRKGDAVLLRGDNGSGKTTLLNVLSGFVRPDTGRASSTTGNGGEVDILRTSPERLAREGLGRLWQDIRLFPTLTCLENVLVASHQVVGGGVMRPGRWLRVRSEMREARDLALHHLERVGMSDRASSTAERLSLGQMKRVALARLLQAGASVLLLDEPLASLDRPSAERLLELLAVLNREEGRSILVAEHQFERMVPICTETWYLEGGSLEARPRNEGARQ
jgi:ABC-type branched-subunit amino acid transport system ATPase component